ncbi:hypothetical protein NEUTE2DRAFT_127085 [Neurospora tetrasperma FGSC 2509]|nr:hypothetical protein NEUTE2DRAFT_127085 [Neurospora tetrasperma FGSC 2509]
MSTASPRLVQREVAEGKKVLNKEPKKERPQKRKRPAEVTTRPILCVDRALQRLAQHRAPKLSASTTQRSTTQAVDSSTMVTLVHHVENEALGIQSQSRLHIPTRPRYPKGGRDYVGYSCYDIVRSVRELISVSSHSLPGLGFVPDLNTGSQVYLESFC